jgi:tetratricopeptide (TPR) repeat protein
MVIEDSEQAVAKRKLIIHDALAFLSLIAGTVVLFAVTLFLFRSFTGHRADLAREWSDRGIAAMGAGKNAAAVEALRTALSYDPGNGRYELLLAQALGEAGHLDESYNYFAGLWEGQPGNGFINLELARLAAKRKDKQAAINFYRAAINGTWETGDGMERRPQVRLELARYLIEQKELAPARLELLIAAGNAPGTPEFDLMLGNLLQQADDPSDAWGYYKKAIAAQPRNLEALEAAGRLAYAAGDYGAAHRILVKAEAVHAEAPASGPWTADDLTLLHNAGRILQLLPAESHSGRERAARILADRAIAKSRLGTCTASFAGDAQPPAALQQLSQRWAGQDGTADAVALSHDSDLQDSAMQLVYDTERETGRLCAPATGDDALLSLLAQSHEPATAQQKTGELP